MRHARLACLTALGVSPAHARKIEQEGSCKVVTHTRYVYATAEPAVSYGGASGGYEAGSTEGHEEVPAGGEGGHGYGNGYATASAVKPSVSPDCSDSSSSKTGASGYAASYAVGSSPSGSYAHGLSIPGDSYATGASSSGASAATGYAASYGVPFGNASTASGVGYSTRGAYATGVSSVSSYGSVSSFATIVVKPSGVSSAPEVSSTDASVVSSTEAVTSSSLESSSVPSTAFPTVSALATTTPTSSYGPNVFDGDFDTAATPEWLGTREDVGTQAQSGAYVLSATANSATYETARFDYMVGPLEWASLYHISFYYRLASAVPEGVTCSVTASMGTASFYKADVVLADAAARWVNVQVGDIAINSAINDLTFDFACEGARYFAAGGALTFWLDSVHLAAQLVATPTPSQLCSTSAPTGTPGPNLVRHGAIDASPGDDSMPYWTWQPRVTHMQDVGREAHSAPWVLATRIDALLPYGIVYVTLDGASAAAKYTVSLWVRFVSTNMPGDSKPTLSTGVGAKTVDLHRFSAQDVERGWTNILVRDVVMERASDRLEINFYDERYPEQLVEGGEIEYWLDDVQMFEQTPDVVTCM